MPVRQALIEKLNALPINLLEEVEDFVDFLCSRDRDRSLAYAAGLASAPAFAKVWNNPEDDVYDAV